MQKGVLSFEDLKEGMMVTGKIKNVVDFGAFVDIGLKETALLHLSEMSDHFVKDPMEVVKVGDVKECRIIGLDVDRRRISLSCKTPGNSGGSGARSGGSREGASSHDGDAHGDGKRRVVVAKKADGGAGKTSTLVADSHSPGVRGGRDNVSHDRDGRNGRQDGRNGGYSGKPAREDDGMTYNPFAILLKDRK
jgi:uncharacterized protein